MPSDSKKWRIILRRISRSSTRSAVFERRTFLDIPRRTLELSFATAKHEIELSHDLVQNE